VATVTYAEILEAAWAEHLAPRDADAPTVVSLFAGAGGSSLGYSMAGYRELLAVEWDDAAVATLRANVPGLAIHHGDIAALSVEECLALAGIAPGELDLLDASPTCQGFSTAGKRQLDDSRNQLFREFVRLLRGLRPRAFVLENVPGLVRGKMRLVFAEMLRELKASGYRVSARVLDAAYHGVPQHRERLIVIGAREDLAATPTHPLPGTGPIRYHAAVEGLAEAAQVAPPVTPLQVERWRATRRGCAHPERFSLLRLSWDRIAPTILKEPGLGGHFHPDEPRRLGAAELRRIASFPDGFAFEGDWMDAVNGIGSSVPPLLMRAIARHVRSTILEPDRG
jgi:DNA (cytosine-5)-methyltransferase 1